MSDDWNPGFVGPAMRPGARPGCALVRPRGTQLQSVTCDTVRGMPRRLRGQASGRSAAPRSRWRDEERRVADARRSGCRRSRPGAVRVHHRVPHRLSCLIDRARELSRRAGRPVARHRPLGLSRTLHPRGNPARPPRGAGRGAQPFAGGDPVRHRRRPGAAAGLARQRVHRRRNADLRDPRRGGGRKRPFDPRQPPRHRAREVARRGTRCRNAGHGHGLHRSARHRARPSAGSSRQRWFAPPQKRHCCTRAPPAVLLSITSSTRPLWRASMA